MTDPSASPPPDRPTAGVFRVGAWEANAATNELRRDGEVVRVEPRVMEVLAVLCDHAGSVVSREALLAAAWPGMVVGDEAVTQSVIKLRRALGDHPRSPAYIETIAKRGYRLIAPVSYDVAAGPAASTRDAGDSRRSSQRKRRLSMAALAVAMLAIAIGYVAWRALAGDDEADVVASTEQAALTLVVVPFETAQPDGEHGYLARGIANELSSELASVPGIRVVRTSSPATVRASTRGPRYVVSGTVARSGDTLRVDIHVTDDETLAPVLSERFERPFGDLFAMQDDLIARLTARLPRELADAARQRAASRYTRSLAAYDRFLQAQAQFLVREPAANASARALYRSALDADPKFARAYAGLAMTHAMDHVLQPSAESAAGLDRALDLANTAKLIDPRLAEVHWAIGFVHTQARQHELALESLRTAIRLDPSFADAHALTAGIETYLGRPDRSIPRLRTALRLAPEGGYLYYLILGRAYLFTNDVEQALINLREATARNPVDVETRVFLAAALAAAGDTAAAQWEVEEIRALAPEFRVARWLERYPMRDSAQRARLASLLQPFGV